jgi:hypothetical protein
MMPAAGIAISGAVEGELDEAVLRRLLTGAGATMDRVYGKQGKAQLRERISAYNFAARHGPWVVLVDLGDGCAPALVREWVPEPAEFLCLRVAVREIESWLLADRERLAEFLSVPVSRVPQRPDEVPDPKLSLVNLARGSRRREIRQGLVPRPGSGRRVGPEYVSRLQEFVSRRWRPAEAEDNSPSLRGCRAAIARLAERLGPHRRV